MTAVHPAPFLVDEQAAAAMLGLTRRTLQSWRHTRAVALPFVRISSRCVRYRLSDLEEFAFTRLRTSTSDRSGLSVDAG